MLPSPTKTPTCSSTCNRRGTRSAITPLILSPIASTPGNITAAAAGTEYIGVYLVIAVSAYINIVHKRVTNIAKDIRAIDCWLNEFKDSLSEIKDKLAFLKRGVIALVCNAGLLDIK